jgi:hypothetical protein
MYLKSNLLYKIKIMISLLELIKYYNIFPYK